MFNIVLAFIQYYYYILLIARFEKERELTENEIIDKAYSRKTKRYV